MTILEIGGNMCHIRNMKIEKDNLITTMIAEEKTSLLGQIPMKGEILEEGTNPPQNTLIEGTIDPTEEAVVQRVLPEGSNTIRGQWDKNQGVIIKETTTIGILIEEVGEVETTILGTLEVEDLTPIEKEADTEEEVVSEEGVNSEVGEASEEVEGEEWNPMTKCLNNIPMMLRLQIKLL
jgi:hypothetical protein